MWKLQTCNSNMNLPPPSPSPLDLASNAAAAAATSCVSGALRRLLCGSLHRGNSEFNEEAVVVQERRAPGEQMISPVPGLVARLMGLDSMPVHPYAPPLDSIGRSRSTNSITSWPSDAAHKRSCSDPQISSTSSFHEAPTYLRQENDEFLVLSFSPESKEREVKNSRNAKKERRAERSGMQQDSCGIEVRRNKGEHTRSRKSAYARRKLELECNSQNSSPVSVLDHPVDIDGEADCSLSSDSPVSEQDWREVALKLADCNKVGEICSAVAISKIWQDGGMRLRGEGKNKSRKPEQAHRGLSTNWAIICKIVEEDMRVSNWTSRGMRKPGDVAKIGAEIGLQLLDCLLCEAVADFSNCFHTR